MVRSQHLLREGASKSQRENDGYFSPDKVSFVVMLHHVSRGNVIYFPQGERARRARWCFGDDFAARDVFSEMFISMFLQVREKSSQ